MTNGLAIVHDGRAVRLKWHRLRRRMSDPLFGAAVMAEGFALGASMELDLRVRADGGFVVLHDATLDGETTGSGPVAAATVEQLRAITMKDGRPLVLSEDLAQMLGTAHPEALLQFDMKDDFSAIGEAGIAHLQQHFAVLPASVIVSGHDPELIVGVREKLPNLLRGIDPTDKLVDLFQSQGFDAVEDALLADLNGPTAPNTVYLHWELVLAAERNGLDIVSLCHLHGALVDAWTFTLRDPENGFNDREWDAVSRLVAAGVDQITTDEAIATEAAWAKRMNA